jgi:hypothetical protein
MCTYEPLRADPQARGKRKQLTAWMRMKFRDSSPLYDGDRAYLAEHRRRFQFSTV